LWGGNGCGSVGCCWAARVRWTTVKGDMSPIIWGSPPLLMPLKISSTLLTDSESEAAGDVAAAPGWAGVVAAAVGWAGAGPGCVGAVGVAEDGCIGGPSEGRGGRSGGAAGTNGSAAGAEGAAAGAEGGVAAPEGGTAALEGGTGLLGCAGAWVRRTQRSRIRPRKRGDRSAARSGSIAGSSPRAHPQETTTPRMMASNSVHALNYTSPRDTTTSSAPDIGILLGSTRSSRTYILYDRHNRHNRSGKVPANDG
jgi:hypothetical protein